MDPLTLIIILAIIGLVLILLLGIIVWTFLRRGDRQKAAKEASTPKKKPVRLKEMTAPEDGKTELEPSAEPIETAPARPIAATPASPTPTATADQSELGDKIKILIVDDNPGTRDNVSRLLYFEDDLEVIGQAINGREGIEMAIESKPHIVLMDINMPDMDGITATEKMSLEAPYSQVIIMSVQSEQHYMRRAMTAGARDFQPKPFTADELISCIRRVYNIGLPIYRQIEVAEQAQTQLAQARPSGRSGPGGLVIAVYSPKGGIGTSTFAVNLAVALQQEQGDIVLMDADFQFGDISVHLNTRPIRTVSDSIHHNELEVELLPELLLSHNSGLKLLLGPPQPELADAITPGMVAEIIKSLRELFKIVIIDTSSQLTDRTLTVLDNADRILVITTPELPAVKSVKLFLELANQLEFSPDRLEVVMNRANLPGGVSPRRIEQVLKLTRSYYIPYDPRIHAAINKGVAINQQDASAPSAQAIAGIATELWQRLNEPGEVLIAEMA